MEDTELREEVCPEDDRWLSASREGLSEAAQESIWGEVQQMWGISSKETQQMARCDSSPG